MVDIFGTVLQGPRKLTQFVIASEAKQSSAARVALDCFVASLLAMTESSEATGLG
jgi:hypothetical protein